METEISTVEELKASMLKPLENFDYRGARDLGVWGVAPFALSRDSDALARANWEVVSGDLLRRFPEAAETIEASHWAYGWMRTLLVDTQDENALRAVLGWVARLGDHPIADEDRFAEEESMERHAAWSDWGQEMVAEAALFANIGELIGSDGEYGPNFQGDDDRAREAFDESMAHTGNDVDQGTLARFLMQAFRPLGNVDQGVA